MNAKGKIRSSGAALARYLMTGEKGEIAQLIETRGLDAFGSDPVAAFEMLERLADENTRCEKPFFHGHIRLSPGEDLTDAQWMQSLERMEKRLGFTGQPRIVSFHIDTASGERHLHCGWYRVDLESMRAIDPGLYKNHLMQLARTLEREFGLREVSSERQPHDKARAADRDEYEEAKRLGTDVRAIRTQILDCLEKSDGGKSFKAALEERGFILANGDRRDCFVVIDPAGGQHALNKKLTGMKLAALRERFADLDRSQLPAVERAQAMQRDRQAERPVLPEPANENGHRTPQQQMQDFVESLPKVEAVPLPPNIVFLREPPAVADKIDHLWQSVDALTEQQKSREATQQPNTDAGSEFRAAAASITEPHAAVHEPNTAHELAASADAAIDHATHAGAGMLNGLGKLFADVIGWLGDFIAPSAPPTRAEAETMARATEEKREQQAAHAEEEAKHWLVIDAQRKAREREKAETEQDQAHRKNQDRFWDRDRDR